MYAIELYTSSSHNDDQVRRVAGEFETEAHAEAEAARRARDWANKGFFHGYRIVPV